MKYKMSIIKNKLTLIIGVAAILIQSCNFSRTERREIKFKAGMKEVVNKYMKELEPDIFRTSPGWFRFDTVTTHKVIVTIFNSDKLPKNYDEKKKLALDIASNVYPLIENKNDYSEVEIVFRNESGTAIRMKTKSNYPFSYEEIEEYIEKNKTINREQ